MNSSITFTEPVSLVRRFILALPRIWLRRNAAKKLGALQSAFRIAEDVRHKAETFGVSELASLCRVGQFLVLCDADLTVLVTEIHCADEAWTKSVLARNLAVVLVESADDMPHLLGKNLRNEIASLFGESAHFSNLGVVSKSFSAFLREHEDDLLEIRNTIGAHRDHEARNQAVVLGKMDVDQICAVAIKFHELIDELRRLMTEIHSGFSLQKFIESRSNSRSHSARADSIKNGES